MNATIKCVRFGCHSDDADNSNILGCDTVAFGRKLLVFQRTVLPSELRPRLLSTRLVAIFYRRFGTNYRSHLQGSGIQKDVTLDKTFYNLLLKNEAAAAPAISTFYPYHIAR